MSPTQTSLYAAYIARKNAVFSSNNTLQAFICADFHNLSRCELGITALFAAIGGAVRNSVALVARGSVPSQIFKVVVLWVSVVVAAFQAWGFGAHKSLKHQRMRRAYFLFVALPKGGKWTAIPNTNTESFDLSCVCASHSTAVRNLIKTFVANNIAPIFHRSNHILPVGIYQYGPV